MNATSIDWTARRDERRETEWYLRGRVLRLLEILLDRWEDDVSKVGTLEALAKHVELVSKLGRLATESESAAPAREGLSEEFLTSLIRVHQTERELNGAASEEEKEAQ